MDGICFIKPEFLLVEDRPKSIRPSKGKDANNDEEKQISTTSTDNDLESDKRSSSDLLEKEDEDEPKDVKRKKLQYDKKSKRGQNRSRRAVLKFRSDLNLCKTLFDGNASHQTCSYPNCKFMHNIDTYLAAKPTDIGECCPIYSTKGFCTRGITCRFAKSHLDDNLNNIKSDIYDKMATLDTCNQIQYNLQVTLRKRNYNFDLSKQIINAIDKEKQSRKNAKDELKQKEISSKEDDIAIIEQGTANFNDEKSIGNCLDTDLIKERKCEKEKVDFRNKLILSPLTTCGNLPFRRICKEFGADITCGEMACAVPIINGISQEWALVKRHISEDIFGVQICGNNPQLVTFASQVLKENCNIDFIDLNLGCPIELIYGQGAGSALLRRPNILEAMVRSCARLLDDVPFTVKTRTGVYANKSIAHDLVPKFEQWGAAAVTIHGRSREQRYTKTADWQYIEECAAKAKNIPIIGNGDVLNFEDYNTAKLCAPSVSSVMIGRGALIKPWLFKEIKEQKHWDPSSSERFDIIKKYINYGLEHWGSDTQGVENTRRFFLEWQSFLYRYVPYGILEKPPQQINQRPDPFRGRDDLETLMASSKCSDWIKLSEMFLGPVPDDFNFLPKHKANAF